MVGDKIVFLFSKFVFVLFSKLESKYNFFLCFQSHFFCLAIVLIGLFSLIITTSLFPSIINISPQTDIFSPKLKLVIRTPSNPWATQGRQGASLNRTAPTQRRKPLAPPFLRQPDHHRSPDLIVHPPQIWFSSLALPPLLAWFHHFHLKVNF